MGPEQTEAIVDWEEVRSLFPSLANKTFLNSATMGQLPQSASDAVMAHLQRRDYSAAVDAPKWFDDLDRLRAKLGKLVNATADDIAMIPSTAHGLSIALNGIDWQSGDRVCRAKARTQATAVAARFIVAKTAAIFGGEDICCGRI